MTGLALVLGLPHEPPLAAVIDALARMAAAEGPMKTRPAAVTSSTKPGFSERKP